ncbi:hypothetical protein V282_02482, partial [Staphylococcus aureus F76239]
FFNSSQGPQQREIGFPISTDNASWGVGPNKENENALVTSFFQF